MSGHAMHKLWDWNKVHELVIDQANEVVEGFGIGDVNWFLRDSNVSLLEQPSNASPTTPEKRRGSDLSITHATNLVTPSSPHLLVLNTNENTVSKTRPSIAPIQEEDAQSVLTVSTNTIPSKESRRRGSTSSIASGGSTASNGSSVGGGRFFSKLKHRLQRSDSVGTSSSPTQLFRNDYNIDKSSLEKPPSIDTSVNGQTSIDSSESKSPLSDTSKSKIFLDPELEFGDPRLAEYIKYFLQDTKKNHKPFTNNNIQRVNSVLIASPIPKSPKASEVGKFTGLFRRRSSVATSAPTSPVRTIDQSINNSSTTLEKKTEEERESDSGISTFKKLKPLKHVAFHSLTFLIDPPQQIPSRNPRKGNVEVLPLGVVRIHPLTEEDKIQMEKSLRGQGGGLVVGGTGAFSLTKKESKQKEEEGVELKPKNPETSNNNGEEDPAIEPHAKSLGIDKPMAHSVSRAGYKAPIKKMALDLMYSRCCHLREILPIPGIAKQIPKGSMAPLPYLLFRNPTPTMIEIETFADFIRIAPIICVSLDGISLSYEQLKILLSAMSAKTQLEKLSLRNTPLDSNGWTLFCWFLSRNKFINKLDITQCPPLSVTKKKKKVKPEEEAIVRMVCNKENRTDMDWTMFTAALIARGGIEELILTGCCITDSRVFETLIRKAIAIKTSKLGLAYNQLSPQQFHVVLDSYFPASKTRGLDLGYNDFLSSAFLQIIIEIFKKEDLQDKLSVSKLGFLSLNATNLRFNSLFKDVFENVLATLPNLKYLDFSNNPKLFGNFSTRNLGFEAPSSSALASDSSFDEASKSNSTPESINSYFCSILPTFKALVRLHLDNNGLSSQSLMNLFEIVPFCKNLAYLSIIGNHLDIYSATSLIQGLKNSTTLMTVDGEFLGLPESFRERIGSYSMRNMENFYNNNIRKKLSHEEDLDEGHSKSLTDQLNELLSQRHNGKLDLSLPQVKEFIERTQRYRQELKESILDLFALQYSGDLNIEGKEALIRLLFVDSSLERGLRMIDKSLVDHDENITTLDILNMNLAEDEKNILKVSAHEKAFKDHNDTLSHFDSASLPISRNQSSATLSSLNKEEGSVMKLARVTDKDALLDKFDNLSGEEIRKKMLNFDLSDLDNLIDTINSARKRGVCFKDIFNDKTFIDTFKDDLKQRIENLKRFAASHSKENGGEPMESQEIDLSRSIDGTNDDDGMSSKDMSEAYDRILSKFNK